MAFGPAWPSVTITQITNRVTELDILSFYLGINSVPCLIKSPLREDEKPSFGLYLSRNNRIFYKDFSTGETGGVFDLLGQIWRVGFGEVLQRINFDLDKISLSPSTNLVGRIGDKEGEKLQLSSLNTKLECKVREWKKHDIDYWESFGISLPWLKFGSVYPISHIIVTKGDKTYTIPAEKYAYVYVERKDGKISLKIYQPFSKEHKWSNSHDSSVWDLWTKLPEKGENLIITSSRKDALCIWENTLIPSVSLQAESNWPKKHIIEELKDRFTNIFVLYDNDYSAEENHGRLLGKRIAREFGLTQIEIPTEYYSKDTSDLCKNHCREAVKYVITELIKSKNYGK